MNHRVAILFTSCFDLFSRLNQAAVISICKNGSSETTLHFWKPPDLLVSGGLSYACRHPVRTRARGVRAPRDVGVGALGVGPRGSSSQSNALTPFGPVYRVCVCFVGMAGEVAHRGDDEAANIAGRRRSRFIPPGVFSRDVLDGDSRDSVAGGPGVMVRPGMKAVVPRG